MKLAVVENNTDILNRVIELANRNSKTLGFFPRGAFEQKAVQKRIIAAISEDVVYGYVLFEYTKSRHIVSIVHLCVDSQFRKQGVARSLLRELECIVKDKVGGIRVRCRVDYDAHNIWEKLGFKYIQTVAGRSKSGSELAIWRKDLPFPDLFLPILELDKTIVRVCLDLNIFSDSLKARTPITAGAHSVMEDWLSEILDFYVSPELFIELKRDDNENRVAQIKRLAKNNIEISASQMEFRRVRAKIEEIFGNTVKDQSDLNHLAWCGAAKMDYFVTSDEPLLHKNSQIYELIGVKLIHPSELILHTDTLLHATEYQPQRFGETGLLLKPLALDDLNKIVTVFSNDAAEGKKKFVTKLRALLNQPQEIKTKFISHEGIPQGLISYQKNSDSELKVNLVRLAKNTLEDTLSISIVKWLIEKSLSLHTPRLYINDSAIPIAITIACLKFGFYQEGGILIRLTDQGCLDLVGISTKINKYENTGVLPAKYCKKIRLDINRVESSIDKSTLFEVEKNLWPIKIVELNLATYVVSIDPKYAMHLFDSQISAGDLFGGDSKLLLNIENSYYRSIKGHIEAPGRILWYVGKGQRYYESSQAIRAVSYLNEVHTGKPKELFSQFQHLGIYKWSDVLNTVQGNCEEQLMAFIFSHTEILRKPISRKSLNDIWQRDLAKKFHVQAPLKIPDNLFWKIYNLGMGFTDEKREKK